MPALIRNAGRNAERRFFEFFTAHSCKPGAAIRMLFDWLVTG